MKQLIQIFLMDMKMSVKSFMGGYMIIVPMVILIVLKFFLPSVESSTMSFAIVTEGPNAVDKELIEILDEFSDIYTYDSIEDMEQKLRDIGTIEGIYWDPTEEQYISVKERTIKEGTIFSNGAKVIRNYYYYKNYPNAPLVMVYSHGVPPELSDRTKTSPVSSTGGSIFIVYMTIITAFIIGLGVVNDKEYGTIMALQVSPVSKADYYIGKCIFPFIITALYTIISLLVLNLIHVNILQVYLVVVISFSITLLLGLLIGALGKNENEAIGIGKLLGMLGMLGILGGTLLPEAWKWVIWWSPFYWLFDILEEIFTETATWTTVAWKSGVVMGLTSIYFMLLRKKIIKGLS